jgi:hypothetical protein
MERISPQTRATASAPRIWDRVRIRPALPQYVCVRTSCGDGQRALSAVRHQQCLTGVFSCLKRVDLSAPAKTARFLRVEMEEIQKAIGTLNMAEYITNI